jgi:hypothetical protein
MSNLDLVAISKIAAGVGLHPRTIKREAKERGLTTYYIRNVACLKRTEWESVEFPTKKLVETQKKATAAATEKRKAEAANEDRQKDGADAAKEDRQ